jgi:hypothetical protein
MITKRVVAHELGHSIASRFDNEFDSRSISLETTNLYEAACMATRKNEGNGNTLLKNKHLSCVINLGGIYGELLFCGNWEVTNSRLDIEEFLSFNRKSKSQFIGELVNWFWHDEDPYSFYNLSRVNNGCRLFPNEISYRLPYLWESFIVFRDRVNTYQFRTTVEMIYADYKQLGVNSVLKSDLNKYSKKVLGE